jgi:hypothetical protein
MVDQFDEILSITAKVNGVPGAMDQGMPVPDTGTFTAPTESCEEPDRDGEHLGCIHRSAPIRKHTVELTSRATTPFHEQRASNLVGVSGKCTNSIPSKRARVHRNLMDSLDRLADSTAEIKRLRIEAVLTMHKDNLVEH